MSSRSKYPSKQMMIPTAATTLVSVLGNFSASTVQVRNSSIQNNVGVFTSESSHNNASVYFVLKSQEDLVNTINTAQAEEISAKIGQSTREKKWHKSQIIILREMMGMAVYLRGVLTDNKGN
jgi:hypothetical protein